MARLPLPGRGTGPRVVALGGGHGLAASLATIRELERRKNGIEIEDATWEKLKALAVDYKLADELNLR